MAVLHATKRKTLLHTLGAAGLGLGMLTSVIGAPAAMAQEVGSPGVDRQLFQDEGVADLSDEELKQLLITLLQERAGERERAPAPAGDEDASDVVIARMQDGNEGADPAAFEEKRIELYNEFTQALADELGVDNADDVDAAIRIAMMAVIDSHVDDGMLTKGKAEALKALVATADVPIAPGFMVGPHPGAFMIAGHGPGMGPMMPGREGMRRWVVERRENARGGERDARQWSSDDSNENERGARAEKGAKGEKDTNSDDSQGDEEKQG